MFGGASHAFLFFIRNADEIKACLRAYFQDLKKIFGGAPKQTEL